LCAPPAVRSMSSAQNIVGTVHLVFAACAFLALGFMALRFAKLPVTGDEPRPAGFAGWLREALGLRQRGQRDTRVGAERRRAVIFRACGIAIVVCVVLGVASNFLPQSFKNDVPVLFIVEALAVFAFGVSWFVKGKTLMPTAARLAARLRPRPSVAAPPVLDPHTLTE